MKVEQIKEVGEIEDAIENGVFFSIQKLKIRIGRRPQIHLIIYTLCIVTNYHLAFCTVDFRSLKRKIRGLHGNFSKTLCECEYA